MNNNSSEQNVLVGRVVGLHSLQGQLKIHSYTEPRLNIFRYRPWTLVLSSLTTTQQLVCDHPSGREQGKGIVAQIAELKNRDDASVWLDADIYVPRTALPKLRNNEYYWSDLEGLKVLSKEGQLLGIVSHLFATGANDVLVVKGEKEHLIPYLLNQTILHIDLEKKEMKVDWDSNF